MEESVAGFKQRGSWVDIVEHGERVTRALKNVTEEQEITKPLAEWDEWRPKVEERLDEDVSEKTAQKAVVAEGKGERAGMTPDDDVQSAGEKLSESYENLDDPDRAVEGAKQSIGHLKRAVDSASRKAIRKVEGAVYKSVMTQMSPYYFDNELVSANIRRVGQDNYVFEVNVNEDDLKIRVSNALADLEQTVDRWHVDTEKETESVEAAEGVVDAAQEAGTEGKSRPHTN
jgi:competence protein ComGC